MLRREWLDDRVFASLEAAQARHRGRPRRHRGSIATYFVNKSLENDQLDRADAHIVAVALRTAGRSDREPSSETGSTRPGRAALQL
jgi:hypothetical protein